MPEFRSNVVLGITAFPKKDCYIGFRIGKSFFNLPDNAPDDLGSLCVKVDILKQELNKRCTQAIDVVRIAKAVSQDCLCQHFSLLFRIVSEGIGSLKEEQMLKTSTDGNIPETGIRDRTMGQSGRNHENGSRFVGKVRTIGCQVAGSFQIVEDFPEIMGVQGVPNGTGNGLTDVEYHKNHLWLL